jgi:hypothetical protein
VSPESADASTVAWTEALERLEADLRGALAGADAVRWTPPAGLGPLPEELAERASRLLDAQRHTLRHLEDVRQTTARHLSAVRSVPRTESAPAPVYLDLLG